MRKMEIKDCMFGKKLVLFVISVEHGTLMVYTDLTKEVITTLFYHTYDFNGKIISREL